MVRLVVEVVRDMPSFTLLLVILIYTYSVIQFVTREDEEDDGWFIETELKATYNLMYSYWDTTTYNWLKWIYFVIFTFAIPLLFFNLLIAIILDAFDRALDNKKSSDYKEKAALILEFENLLVWNRNKKLDNYLHVIKYKRTEFM